MLWLVELEGPWPCQEALGRPLGARIASISPKRSCIFMLCRMAYDLNISDSYSLSPKGRVSGRLREGENSTSGGMACVSFEGWISNNFTS